MKRSGYREAIKWIADNDDTECLFGEYPSEPVTLSMVADIYGVDIEKATADLKRMLEKQAKK